MALIVKTIPGVYGGVSNQTESLRKDNQVSEMINCNPSLVLGTTRRPNVEAGIITIPENASFIYDYKRDGGEANILTVTTAGDMTAQTIGEGVKTITVAPEVKAYLVHTAAKSLSGITIGDTSYLVNSEQTVGISEIATSLMPELAEIYRSNVTVGESAADKLAYYWMSRSSNDVDHPYNYVAELDDVRYEAESDKSADAARKLTNKIKFQETRCNIESAVVVGHEETFDVIIKTGDVVGSGTLTDIDGFIWTSIDGIVSAPGGTGAFSWVRNSVGNYTVSIVSANEINPISYLLNIGEQEFSVVTEMTKTAVASNLSQQLNNFIGKLVTPTRNTNGFNAEAIGSILKIWKDDLTDFEFNYWDSWGSLASYGWKGAVGKLQDLPSSFPWDGTVVKVNASDGDVTTDYYAIRWEGTWQEYTNRATFEGNIRKLPLLNNMPVVVERHEDGTFEARLLSTADQLKPPLVGNVENNKDPYFVGKEIKQLFYINGRICIVAGDALTFSQTDVLWNFYASTIINILDGDTIEIKIASEKVLEILRVAIFQSGLLIMTSEGQYLFNTEQGISPATIIVNKLSNYAYNDTGGTIYDGDSIVFSGTTGDTARLYRYRVARLTSENKALDLTIQVPTYIQGVVTKITNFVEDGTIIVLTEDSQKLYLYREVVSGDQMVQSSWYTWDFSNILTGNILHTMVIDNYVYLVATEGVFKVPLGVKIFDNTYQHLDIGTVPYESRIELTKWRPKKTQAQVQTPRGRLQLRAVSVAIEGEAILEIYKEDRDFTQNKPIIYNKNINVLSNTDKTVLSIINNNTKPFTISGLALSGTYRDKGKEQL